MKVIICFLFVFFYLTSCDHQDRQSKNLASLNLDKEKTLVIKNSSITKSISKSKGNQKENKSEGFEINSWKCSNLFDLEFYNSFNEISKEVSSLYFNIDTISTILCFCS